jgi:hypothetical protein
MSVSSTDGKAKNDVSINNDPLVPEGLLPSYLAEAFGELYAEDGLLVLGKGLGLLHLLASFVRFYADVEEGHAAESKLRNLPLSLFWDSGTTNARLW